MQQSLLRVIQEEVRRRTSQITADNPAWPCRKGCADCCRRLASVPRVSATEWQSIKAALDQLPPDIAQRIRDSAHATRPITCPLLDHDAGACLVYEARPVACRSYGFYAEREKVLGCERIEAIAVEQQDVVWGNHQALEERLQELGEAKELYRWLDEPAKP